MRYYLFIDESGDHNLENFNPLFPVFTLCGVIISETEYAVLNNRMNELKLEIWKNVNIVFHSRDIRRLQKGFEVLFNVELRALFYEKLNAIIQETPFTVITSNILKEPFIKKFGRTEDVYGISLSFIIERTVFFLDDELRRNAPIELITYVEKRGADADKNLLNYYNKIYGVGTYYVKPDRIQNYFKSFQFRWKRQNINGLQLSDLIAYPIANYVLNPVAVNLAYDIIKPKIYQKNGKKYGVKVFPE